MYHILLIQPKWRPSTSLFRHTDYLFSTGTNFRCGFVHRHGRENRLSHKEAFELFFHNCDLDCLWANRRQSKHPTTRSVGLGRRFPLRTVETATLQKLDKSYLTHTVYGSHSEIFLSHIFVIVRSKNEIGQNYA